MEKDIIYNADCMQIMRGIPNESIDLICTDPPYKVTQRGSSGTMSGYWTTEQTRKGMIFDHNDIEIEQYLPEFYRILKTDSHCYIMCNNYNLPHFFEVIGKSDFHFVKLLVWDKQSKICGRYYMGQYWQRQIIGMINLLCILRLYSENKRTKTNKDYEQEKDKRTNKRV